jgi:hypothetical protein
LYISFIQYKNIIFNNKLILLKSHDTILSNTWFP